MPPSRTIEGKQCTASQHSEQHNQSVATAVNTLAQLLDCTEWEAAYRPKAKQHDTMLLEAGPAEYPADFGFT